MPTIDQIVAQIRTAVYGKDVRENIAEGIEKCYQDAAGTTLHITDIVNNLNQTTSGKVLDACQGKAIIDTLNSYYLHKDRNVANNLTTTVPEKVLDARQGKILNDKFANYVQSANVVNNLNQTTSGKVLDARQGKALNDKFANYILSANIANDLTTTESGKVLDARQGKALKDMIDNSSNITITQIGTTDDYRLRISKIK